MTNFTCPICRQTAIDTIYFIKEFNVQCCSNCGHGSTLPPLTDKELGDLYDSEYFNDQYESSRPGEKDFTKKIRQEDHRYKTLKKQLKTGKVLDIGCGYGYFLFACKEMSNSQLIPFGFDVSSSNKEFIENQLSIPFFSDKRTLSKYVEENGPMDAITFWHSLEHFRDPKKTLNDYSSLLSRGGIIVIDVPIHDSIDAFAGGTSWEGWQIPFHQQHFTSDSVKILLNEAGLEILSSHTYKSGYIYKKIKKSPLKFAARYIAKLFKGGSMVTVCRIPGD